MRGWLTEWRTTAKRVRNWRQFRRGGGVMSARTTTRAACCHPMLSIFWVANITLTRQQSSPSRRFIQKIQFLNSHDFDRRKVMVRQNRLINLERFWFKLFAELAIEHKWPLLCVRPKYVIIAHEICKNQIAAIDKQHGHPFMKHEKWFRNPHI